MSILPYINVPALLTGLDMMMVVPSGMAIVYAHNQRQWSNQWAYVCAFMFMVADLILSIFEAGHRSLLGWIDRDESKRVHVLHKQLGVDRRSSISVLDLARLDKRRRRLHQGYNATALTQ